MYVIAYPETGRRFENTRFFTVGAAVERIEKIRPGKWERLEPKGAGEMAARINQKTGVILVVKDESWTL